MTPLILQRKSNVLSVMVPLQYLSVMISILLYVEVTIYTFFFSKLLSGLTTVSPLINSLESRKVVYMFIASSSSSKAYGILIGSIHERKKKLVSICLSVVRLLLEDCQSRVMLGLIFDINKIIYFILFYIRRNIIY